MNRYEARLAHLSDILENFYIKDSVLMWKINIDKHPIKDTPAGSFDCDGYLTTKLNGKAHRVHRLMYQIYHNLDTLDPKTLIDHKDRNKANNSKENLQLVNCFENSHNLSKYTRNKSGYTGVHWRKSTSKWRVTMMSNNKIYELGCFNDVIEAAEAYDIGCLRRDHNNHVLNFPEKKEKYLKYIKENGTDIGHDKPKKCAIQSGHKYVTYTCNQQGVQRWKVLIIKDGQRHQKFFPYDVEGLSAAVKWRNETYQLINGEPFQEPSK